MKTQALSELDYPPPEPKRSRDWLSRLTELSHARHVAFRNGDTILVKKYTKRIKAIVRGVKSS